MESNNIITYEKSNVNSTVKILSIIGLLSGIAGIIYCVNSIINLISSLNPNKSVYGNEWYIYLNNIILPIMIPISILLFSIGLIFLYKKGKHSLIKISFIMYIIYTVYNIIMFIVSTIPNISNLGEINIIKIIYMLIIELNKLVTLTLAILWFSNKLKNYNILITLSLLMFLFTFFGEVSAIINMFIYGEDIIDMLISFITGLFIFGCPVYIYSLFIILCSKKYPSTLLQQPSSCDDNKINTLNTLDEKCV